MIRRLVLSDRQHQAVLDLENTNEIGNALTARWMFRDRSKDWRGSAYVWTPTVPVPTRTTTDRRRERAELVGGLDAAQRDGDGGAGVRVPALSGWGGVDRRRDLRQRCG